MHVLRRLWPVLILVASLVVSYSASASQPFDAKAFQDAQAAGRSILIDVSASWCPICRKQRPIIQQIQRERPNLVVFEVDFDAAKDVLKRLRAQSQSTLIMFKGSTEVARSTGDTDPDRIRALVAKGL
jgi:thioredoxin 1